MSYQSHNLQQGSQTWHEFRSNHFGASEAAAMLGLSKYTTRSELLRQKATGIIKEVDAGTQAIFNRGHETEALARPIVEAQIGEQLSPVTCSKGKLSCSCDGITFDDSTAWEHKQWNVLLANEVALEELPEEHQPQCQQILMITGAERLIFTVSDGTPGNMVSMDVLPDPSWFERIRAGWEQFAIDLANYQHVEHAEKPKAEAIMDLPALSVQATGMVTHSNLPEFKAAAETYIANINTDLQTDQHFADAEATVKFCKSTEEKLEVTKAAILAQTATIDEVIRAVDHIQAQLRDKRLMLDKLVKTEKESRKTAMVAEFSAKITEHIYALQAEISGINLMPLIPKTDFGGAIKGLKSLASIHDALNTALANAKIEADTIAKDIRAKLAWCKDNATGMSFLFPDLQQIIVKPMDDFMLTIVSRIEAHKKAEEERIRAHQEAALNAERVRIQQEEEAKARAKVEAEKRSAEEEQRKADLAKHVTLYDPDAEAGALKVQPQPEPAAPVAKPDNVVVIEHQDVIGAFMASREFGKDAGRIRAALVEYEKFKSSYKGNKAA